MRPSIASSRPSTPANTVCSWSIMESLESRLLLASAPVFVGPGGLSSAQPVADRYVLNPGDSLQSLTIPIDGFDADGNALTITATGSPHLSVQVAQSSQFAKLNFVSSDGTTVIGSVLLQLYGDLSPEAVNRFITLATKYITSEATPQILDPTAENPAFYTDVVVHRVIPVINDTPEISGLIQTGDRLNGNGTGDSPLPDFRGEFSSLLGYEGVGVVAFANQGAGSATANSQFFITDAAIPFLNGGWPVFGQVISGWDVIRNVIDRERDGNDRPLDPPLLKSVEILTSPQDGSIFVTPQAGFTGQETITVTLDDGTGLHTTRQFTIQPTQPTLPVIDTVSDLDLESDTLGTIPFTVSYAGPFGASLGISAFHNYHGTGTVKIQTVRLPVENTYGSTFSPDVNYDGTSFTATFLATLLNFGNATRIVQRAAVAYGSRPTIAGIDPQAVVAGSSVTVPIDISDDKANSFVLTASCDTPGVTVTVQEGSYAVKVDVAASVTAATARVTVTALESTYKDGHFKPTTASFDVNIGQFTLGTIPNMTEVLPGEQRDIPLTVQVPIDASVPRTLSWDIQNTYQGPGTIAALVTGDAATGYTLSVTMPEDYDESGFSFTVKATMVEFPALAAQEQSFLVQSDIRPIISDLAPLFMAPGSTREVLFSVVDNVSFSTAMNVRAEAFDDQGVLLPPATATVALVSPTQYRLTVAAPANYYGVLTVKISAIETDVAANHPTLLPAMQTLNVITMGFVPVEPQVVVNPDGHGVTIPLEGYSSDGNPLTYTATAGNADLVVSVAPQTNRYAELSFNDADGNFLGKILIQLFDDRSPDGVQRFVDLATKAVVNGQLVNVGGANPYPYYHNVPLTLLARGQFMQVGDATASGLAPFTNDVGPALGQSGNLSLDGPGMLAYAPTSVSGKSDAQFVIDDGSQSPRNNLNRLIFAQVVSGWDVLRRLEMSQTVGTGTSLVEPPVLSGVTILARPSDPTMTMATVTIVSANAGLTGEIPVTITATDQGGHSYSQQITATMAAPATAARAQVTIITTDVVATGRDTAIPFQIQRTDNGAFAFRMYTTYQGPGAIGLSATLANGTKDYLLHIVLPPDYNGEAFSALILPVETGLGRNGLLVGQRIRISFGTKPQVDISDVTHDPSTGATATVPGTITSNADDFTFSAPQADGGATATIIKDANNPKAFSVQVTIPSSTFTGVIHVSFTVVETRYIDFPNTRRTTVSFTVATFGATIPGSLFEVPTNGRSLSIGVDGLDPAGNGLTYSAQSDDQSLHLSWELGGVTGRRFARLTFVDTEPVDEDGDGIPESYRNVAGSEQVITIMLYDDLAPQAVQRFIDLSTNYRGIVSTDPDTGEETTTYTMDPATPGYADADPFYTDVDIYELLTGGLFYTGDAVNNDGTGKSGLPALNTSFMDTWAYRQLSFAGPGVLAFDNSGGNPATSDAEFFITQRPFKNAEGRYAIFGQIVSGWDTYNDLAFRARSRDEAKNNAPIVPPRLQSVEVVPGAANKSDAVLMIRADQNFTGPAQVDVTITDSFGHSVSKTITIQPDSAIGSMAQVEGTDDAARSIGIRNLPPATRDVDMEFQQTHPADVTVVARTGNTYRGPGEVLVTTTSTGKETQDDGSVLETFDLHITLPQDYDGTPVVFWLWVEPQGAGNAEGSMFVFYFSTLGDAPVIGDTVTLTDADGNPLLDTEGKPASAATGTEAHFTLDITADETVHTTIETRVEGQAGTAVQPVVKDDSGVFTVTVPEGFYGIVTVYVSAVQDKDLSTNVFDPTSRTFSIAFSPDRDAPNQVAPVLWRIEKNGQVVRQTEDFILVGTTDQGLWVYDANDPSALLGKYQWPDTGTSRGQPTIYDLQVMTYGSGPNARQILFVAAGTRGLVSFRLDKNNPDNVLELMDTYQPPQASGFQAVEIVQVALEERTVTVSSGDLVTQLAYVGTRGQGLMILDVSNPGLLGRDPANPTNANARRPLTWVNALYPTWETQMKYQNFPRATQLRPLALRWPTSIFVRNGTILLTDILSGYIVSINASSPEVIVRSRDLQLASPIWDASIDGNRLYVLAENGLHVYDISTFYAPRTISFWRHEYSAGTGVIPSLEVHGNTAVVGYADGFDFLNVRDPARITFWGTQAGPGATPTSSSGQGIFASAWSDSSSDESQRDYSYAGLTPSYVATGSDITWMLPNGLGGVTAIDGTLLNRMVQISTRATIRDVNGTPVTFAIAGGGYIQVTLDEAQTHIDRLDVVNSTAATRVTVTTPSGILTEIGEIDVHGSLYALVAPTVVLAGDATIDGTARLITLSNVGGAAGPQKTFTIGEAPAGQGVAIRLGSVYDLSINSGTPITSLTAVRWLDDETARPETTDSQTDVIDAPSVGRLLVTGRVGQPGDFQADLTLSDGQAGPAIAVVSVAGSISESDWNVGAVRTAIIGGDLGGQWQALSIGALTVRGDLDGWTGLLTQQAVAGSRALTLSYLNVLGSITDSRVLAAGRVGTVVAAAMRDSEVYAGYLAASTYTPAAVALPTAQQMQDAALFDSLGSIASLTIRGQRSGIGYVDSFVNSDIAARNLGVINLAYARRDNGGTEFGLICDSLARFAYRDAATTYTWTNLTGPDPGDFGDLVTRVV